MKIIKICIILFLTMTNVFFAETEELVITLKNNEINTIDVNNIQSIKFDILNSIQTNSIGNNQKIKNYPNPCKRFTKFEFYSTCHQKVNFAIFNIYGELVLKLGDCNAEAGKNILTFELKDVHNNYLSPGVYFYRILTDQFLCQDKIVIINEE